MVIATVMDFGENDMLRYLGFGLLLIGIAEVGCIANARADCSPDTKVHLKLAIDSYKEWETYNEEATNTSEEQAKAEWDNFAHEIRWINDHGDVENCSTADRRVYYFFRVKLDETDVAKGYADVQGGMAEAYGVTPDVLASNLNDALDIYYEDASELYFLGFSKTEPTGYALLKLDVKNWFSKLHRQFKSWESSQRFPAIPPTAPKAVHHSCKSADRPPTVAKAAEAQYPESARDLGLGTVTVEVSVTVGTRGEVVATSILSSSSNMLIDEAAITAARQSTYSAAIKSCEPTVGSLVFHAVLEP